jgi:hypothetical protein
MDFSLVDEGNPLPGVNEHQTVLTQMELTAQEIHKSLNVIFKRIIDSGKHKGENEVKI